MSFVHIEEFLSHPINSKEESSLLIDHLLKVGKTSEKLFSKMNFKNTRIAFYSGLLHDIGKLNRFYQEIFREPKEENRNKVKENALKTYVQKHSVFSAWAAHKLLKKLDLDNDSVDKILILIYCHHTKLKYSLGKISKGEQFKTSQESIERVLPKFESEISKISEFPKLNWESCFRRFPHPINFDLELKPSKFPDDYLEMSCAFSCLLQADRGSFSEWSIPNFDLKINADKLVKSDSTLSKLRTNFQKSAIGSIDPDESITVINAPTGIGKTKVFLDMMNKYARNKNVKRVFYFSPLLALTADFERKINKVISKEEHEDILVYNHLFSGSLKDKHENDNPSYSGKWFENESFNKKFIITTTQRFLMTMYGNSVSDKMKIASFANSMLILDEIQTIPKPILSNLVNIFKKMNEYMGTKFLLVSATIPHEIKNIKQVGPSNDDLKEYLTKTKKQISIVDQIDIQKIPIKKTLVMTNTRKKAVNLYSQIKQTYPDNKIMYISTGVRKKDRYDMLEKLSEESDYILIATQVVEAGVDISFSHVYREEAPLDNIIQVMGRLNREGENKDALLTIYKTDNKPIPYSPLEFEVTQEKIQNKTDSVQIYDILNEYYAEVSVRNKRNTNDAEELKRHMERMDFEEVWKFVKDNVLRENYYDTVFIPNSEDWDSVKKELLCEMDLNKSKHKLKKFGNLTASLPKSPYNIGLELFDEELIKKNILLPKKEQLQTIYDKNIGLDKWLQEDVLDT